MKILFTSVPVEPAISIIKNKLQQDPQISNRTSMSIQHIITLHEYCFKNTCFPFQGKYYEQDHCAVMGSPISSFVANLFMEEFESKAISTAPTHPGFGSGMWMTLLSSNRQNIANSSFNILIPLTHIFNSTHQLQTVMDLSPS